MEGFPSHWIHLSPLSAVRLVSTDVRTSFRADKQRQRGGIRQPVPALGVRVIELTRTADSRSAGWAASVVEIVDNLDRRVYREDFGVFPGALSVLDARSYRAGLDHVAHG